MSLDLSQYLSMKARDAAEEECSRLRAEVARLTGVSDDLRKGWNAEISKKTDLLVKLSDAEARAQAAETERDEALKNFNIVWDDREDARMQLSAARSRIEKLMGRMVMIDINGAGFAAPIPVADALKVEREIVAHLTQSVEDLQARAQSAEAERDALKAEFDQLWGRFEDEKAALAELREAARKLANAAARLSVAAQTTGGVAGRDEGLCAEIDRLSQPLGVVRALIEKENGDAVDGV